jgi:hypothetical protein
MKIDFPTIVSLTHHPPRSNPDSADDGNATLSTDDGKPPADATPPADLPVEEPENQDVNQVAPKANASDVAKGNLLRPEVGIIIRLID